MEKEWTTCKNKACGRPRHKDSPCVCGEEPVQEEKGGSE